MASVHGMPTDEEIERARTPAGGGTRTQLEQWGVPWPPPSGWRRRLRTASERDALGSPSPQSTDPDYDVGAATRE